MSELERKAMVYFDTSPNIIEWISEELEVKYLDTTTNKLRTYYPDMVIKFINKQGEEHTSIIEVKSSREAKPPARQGKNYQDRLKLWTLNSCKFNAAKKFASQRGWSFQILTEEHLK